VSIAQLIKTFYRIKIFNLRSLRRIVEQLRTKSMMFSYYIVRVVELIKNMIKT